MNSVEPGRSTSPVEVTNVSVHGFWLFVGEREHFVAFAEFPWFRDAAIGAITNVQLPSPRHLYWPDLDIDLAVESLEHPEKYPLVSKAQPDKALQPTRRRPRLAKSKPPARTARG
jgi:Protein of unknown function (DUF2442)